MVKASALYIVVIVSLLIAVISASLLTIAFYYRLGVQKKVRQERLLVNLQSGCEALLSGGFNTDDEFHLMDLYGNQKDSLIFRKEIWGVYELGTVKAFELKDTVQRTFFIGDAFSDPNAIYLADEDRPLSISGKTALTGDAKLPKSGLQRAYVDGQPYEGKELITGKITKSDRDLPSLNLKFLEEINKRLKKAEGPPRPAADSLFNTFFNTVQLYKLRPDQRTIKDVKLRGKIILVSDTIINIAASAVLEDVQIYAPAIVVDSGFTGSCQLFARDSIIIGKDCKFNYPSFAGVFKPEDGKVQAKINIGEGGTFAGILLSYEKKQSDLQTLISLRKNSEVRGEVFATGYIKLEREVTVYGKIYAKRFMMQTPNTLYENYLIDFTLNRKLLSKYYLSSPIFKTAVPDQKILKWLN
ncbi:hypothetical protein [Pedobacter steynii]|uniref:Uncharacterized protein n=1 Tax=Pedobacter steynii TaxID=430522 RepID=A0A1D7QD74_9SPHI|nr:hypothetical protein [Pedobacter steynii]AOM76529.1 hypothetical protein BFS30_04790 [Pedobacter steynii]